jgi:hypothetical protein
MRSHYQEVVRLSDRAVKQSLGFQDLRPGSVTYGGRVTPEMGYAEAGASARGVDRLVCAYYCGESRYAGDARLLERAVLFAEHLLREQHADGTLDLKTTNFHDATYVGFNVQVLAYTYRLLRQESTGSEAEKGLIRHLGSFLERGAAGMLSGGFHTPNHRWVMASGLSLLYRILGTQALRQEAERYLAEGIDCTEYGEYTERSTGVYNVVNNRSLMIVAEELERPELLEHVSRNLRMMLHYFEPDETLFTLKSRRQDYGKKVYPTNYYENYLLMAHRTGDPVFAGVADDLLRLCVERSAAGPPAGTVVHYLLDPDLRKHELRRQSPATSFRFFNPDSGILRVREGEVTLSALTGNTTFCTFQKGSNAVHMKLSATFYGDRGRFVADSIQVADSQVVLRQQKRWGYVRPFASPPATSVWDDMPHASRERANMQDFDTEVRITFRLDEPGSPVEVDARSSGLEGVLYKLELVFVPGGWFETECTREPGTPGRYVIVSGGRVRYQVGWDGIGVDGGFAEHNYAADMRGSEPPEPDAFTVFFTGVSPIGRTVRLAVD